MNRQGLPLQNTMEGLRASANETRSPIFEGRIFT
jgi:hypothetical protein